ncbi:GNAT family N-acetyltransferase [Streptomyces sp. NPDC020412]|uniref:GNAT family N-acetyltransferase n=1 Tax=Streptomyces sp. NPDC020412 TaxID=3365073 RepID=UPI00378FCA74
MDAEQRAAALPSPGRGAAPHRSPVPAARRAVDARSAPTAVRPMTADDLPYVVGEHLAHFPDGFFARLGPAFLTAYCGTYLNNPYARGYLAQTDRGPAGYLLGALDPPGHRAHVLRSHRLSLAARGALSLAVRPRVAGHFLRTRAGRYARTLAPGRRTEPAPPAPTPPAAPSQTALRAPDDDPGTTAVLAYVAVAAPARSLGLGAALINRFVADATDAGCARVGLVTLSGDGGAGPYYERHGWLARGRSTTPDGRSFTTYELPLAADPQDIPDIRDPSKPDPRARAPKSER